MFLRRHMHSVRVARGSSPSGLDGRPVIVCLNHPSWWDPLVALTLARQTFPERKHYAPIDSAALAKYPMFERLGFFGIEPDSARGAATFLRCGKAILADNRSVLWVTAEGSFTDVRTRPVRLKDGVARLAQQSPTALVVPLALEYVFWQERAPEVLACWGEPLSSGATTEQIAAILESTMDRLAQFAKNRQAAAFNVVLSGAAGVGGVYDLWRGLRARVTGRRFAPQHGSEEF